MSWKRVVLCGVVLSAGAPAAPAVAAKPTLKLKSGIVTFDGATYGAAQKVRVSVNPGSVRVFFSGPLTASGACKNNGNDQYKCTTTGTAKVKVSTGALNDRINVSKSAARAHLVGGDGRDNLIGAAGNDIIEGGMGNDTLLGNAGRDRISGGDGDDVITGGPDKDSLFGGIGDDQLFAADGTMDTKLDCGDGPSPIGEDDSVEADDAEPSFRCENV